jgi:S1-C subfamily serine protease
LLAISLPAAAAITACASDPPAAIVGLAVTGCGTGEDHGTGTVVAPGLVLTAAHVVKGARTITVTSGDRNTAGEVVAFDPEMDLAYVRVDPGLAPPVAGGSTVVDDDTAGVAYVVRHGVAQMIPVRVVRDITLDTEDIYIKGLTHRPAFELTADTEPGDSGGPVFVDGALVAVLSLRSGRDHTRAYAIDVARAGSLIRSQLATGTIDDTIDLTRCI